MVLEWVDPTLPVSVISGTIFVAVYRPPPVTVTEHLGFCQRPLDMEFLSKPPPTLSVWSLLVIHALNFCLPLLGAWRPCATFRSPELRCTTVVSLAGPCRLRFDLQSFVPTWFGETDWRRIWS